MTRKTWTTLAALIALVALGSAPVAATPSTTPARQPDEQADRAPAGELLELTWENATYYPVILVRGATIWTQGPQGIVENGDLLVRDGEIVEVGQGLTAPADALVIDGSGRHVTPGIIDAHSHTAADAINEGSNIVTAEVSIEDVLDPDDRAIYLQLAGGTTAAQILHGSANAIGGQSAIVKWRYKVSDADDLLIDDAEPTIKFALGENPKRSNFSIPIPGFPQRYPRTRMGVEQAIRDAFHAARDYVREWDRYQSLSEAGKQRAVPPRTDLQLEAVAQILRGDRFVHSHSYRQDEILMLMRLAEEFDFKIHTFQHVLEGYKVGWELAAHGAMASTFSDWWAYKLEAYDAIPYNGAVMHDQGVVVSFNSDSSELARRLNLEAAKAVKYGGLPEQEALDFVTLNPARQLQIDHRVGSLEPGKDGDFVVWNDHPLSVYSRVEATFIEGRKVFDRELDAEIQANVEAARDELVAKARGDDEAEEEEAAAGEEAPESAETGEQTPEEAEPFRNPPAPDLDYGFDPLGQEGVTAIVGATVHTASGAPIEAGVVLFEDGRITAVGGPGTSIPEGAHRVEAAGKHLFPGLIATDTVLGLTEIGSVAGSVDYAEMGEINSNVRTWIAVNAGSAIIPVTRANGVTHALTAPRGGLIMGQSALIRTDGWTWEAMTAAAPAFMHVDWPRFRGGGFGFFPFGEGVPDEERREERIDRLTETLDAARAYATAKRHESEVDFLHEEDSVLEALVPVVEGELPLMIHTSDQRAIRSALEWAAEQDIRIVLLDSGDAWRVADELAEARVPVIIQSILDMPMRPDEPYDSAYARAARLWEAGVQFAIAGSSGGPNAANIRNAPYHAGMAAAFGLPREEALRSLTLYPAQILGLGDELGSIEAGKAANLVLADGDILEIRTNVERVWIDGSESSLETKHTRLYHKYDERPRPPQLGAEERR